MEVPKQLRIAFKHDSRHPKIPFPNPPLHFSITLSNLPFHLDTTPKMSREQYTPPSLTQPSGGGSNAAGASSSQNAGGFNITGANTFEDVGRPVHYLCGDCDTRVTLKKGDAIRCKECGYRVLYKERTNR